ncbi:hypothetical protein CFN78_08515 [Amycolatopsis antarctica]|uniref:Uncharacterized protein n=1 Tax=Amycolatopsis antarctica TaxID=1854586 RepID=A0A263D6A4_9PSEU|nr:hypothetical protein [Amycolatopsis antarctica]OZM73568.1 hypothetical protein CFN78_08515 [Amycolatopsis antarctica]
MSQQLVSLSTVTTLALAASRYVDSTPAPTPARVALNPHSRCIEIQPRVGYQAPAVEVLGSLMVWTHRLSGITATWWCPAPDRLHITITGRLAPGITARVYDEIPTTACRSLMVLPGDSPETVTADELYVLAMALRDISETEGAA